MNCPHCNSKNLSAVYTDTFPAEETLNEFDYYGEYIELKLVDCLDCGELAIDYKPLTSQ